MLGHASLSEVALGEGSVDAEAQSVAGALFTNSNTFYGSTLTPGAVTISGALYSDADTFYGATVTPGSVTISGALFTDADTFFAATVSLAGAPQQVDGALFENVNTFYGATVASDQTIGGALYANDNGFFGATVSGGGSTEQFTSSGGIGTGWAHKTLSQLKREAERARRKARKKVLVALDRRGMLDERTADIKAYVDSASFDVLAPLADDMFINTAEQAAITAELMRLAFEYARQVADDEDLLLLAA